jgi:hypothetical protein
MFGDLIHGALIGVRDVVGDLVKDQQGKTKEPEDKTVARYYWQHRGKPEELKKFVSENAPAGTNVLAEMDKYERAMEQKLRQRGIIQEGNQ